ncbi:ANTAR domain-containing response regulator [Psychrobium sp. nBUS_13]|uniref:ANTAR domain-containing response regulator n=1 Tax=Psychrobium sp. nBUS_13 TaxID=3395319 RepID=UPI003EC025CA
MMAVSKISPQRLTVLIIDDDMNRAKSFQDALSNTPYDVRYLAHISASFLMEVEKTQPDIILIDINAPKPSIIDDLLTISAHNPKPIVMFSKQDSPNLMRKSIKAGVSAYVSGDTSPYRAKLILDVAVARFNDYQQLRSEIDHLKGQLESRKWIDQAKALLIEKQNMTEQQAYNAVRKMAMDKGRKMEDIAKELISMIQLLNGVKS